MDRNTTVGNDSSVAFLTIASDDLGLPVPIPDSTVRAAVGVLVVLAMDVADCCGTLSLTGGIWEQLDNEEGAGHGRRPSPPPATESDP
jgi:hypothetical protein